MVRLGREITSTTTKDRVEFYFVREDATSADERDEAFTDLLETALDEEDVPANPYGRDGESGQSATSTDPARNADACAESDPPDASDARDAGDGEDEH